MSAGGSNCVGDTVSDASAFFITAFIAEFDTIAGSCFRVTFFCSLFNHQNAGTFPLMMGKRGLSVLCGQTAGRFRFFGMSRRQIHEHGIAGLIAVDTFIVTRVECQCGVPHTFYTIIPVVTYQIQTCFRAAPAAACRLRTGYTVRVVDPVSLFSADDLYKSFASCSEDR